MKVRDVIRRLTDDGWVKVPRKEAIANSNIQLNPARSRFPANFLTTWPKEPTEVTCGKPVSRSSKMSIESVSVDEVEQDRQNQLRQLIAESGEDCLEEYRPGSVGCHELLDRTALLADMLERHILGHPACIARQDWYLLAEQAAAGLRELYQQIGAEHLEVANPGAEES